MAGAVLETEAVVPERSGAARSARESVRFCFLLAAVVAIGFAVRIVYTLAVAPHTGLFPDSLWYHFQAINLRAGLGYVDVSRVLGAFRGIPNSGQARETAYWPPLYPGYLAGGQELFGATVTHLTAPRGRNGCRHRRADRAPRPGHCRPGGWAPRRAARCALPLAHRGGRLTHGRDALCPFRRARSPPRPTCAHAPRHRGLVRARCGDRARDTCPW